ncbi:isoprenylcysteine carboxylmethyltransferase family protein [Candidatus Woesearchaeota archaeon]|nr:isoprenylcysteine carboxylmethyltransferase family protein [Candidatus Woesearchaeota archaeon]
MISMLKILIGVFVLLMIITYAMLGKKCWRFFQFDTAKGGPESEIILWIAIALSVGISIVDFLVEKKSPSTIKIIGLYIFLMGGLIQAFTKKYLQQSTHEEALKKNFHKATNMRIFDKIRHPSKTALLFMIIGMALTLGSTWGTILTFAFFIPAVLFRINQEERILLDEFGDRYYDYQDKTKKLMPVII